MLTFYMGGDVREKIKEGKENARLAKELALRIKIRPMKLIKIEKKKLSYDEFQDCLDIYENNQIYHKNNLKKLIELEDWFCVIREPYPEGASESEILEWRQREKNRRKYCISDYCDEDIRKLLLEQ